MVVSALECILKILGAKEIRSDRNFEVLAVLWRSVTFSRFACLGKVVLFSSFFLVFFVFADSSIKKDFQPVKSSYFCLGQPKKTLEKNQ